MENAKNQNPSQGLKIIIAVLAVIVVAVAVLFFVNVNALKKETAALTAEKTTLQTNLTNLNRELSSVKSTNEALNRSLEAEKTRIEELLAELQTEKTNSKALINRYKREINNLKALVKRYAITIENLEAENAKLKEDNMQLTTDLQTTTLRAEEAEANSERLAELVKKGQYIPARDIELTNLKRNEKETSRIKRARKLKVDFTLVTNEIAQPGTRTVYARLIGPDGYLHTADNRTFEYNGNTLGYTASRDIDYRNEDLMVSVYLDDVKKLPKGTYTVEVYMDGNMIGTKKIETK